MLDQHFDAVIIGSGFGGSVMAYRLAETGLSVCVLERGKPYPPNSFPRSPYRMKSNFWDPSEGLHGMYNIWSFRGIDSIVSSGLGGGSLIYANVLIRKDEKTFVKEDLSNGGYEYWPVTRADLDPHYDQAEEMLNAQRYPFDQDPYDKTSKTIALKLAAGKLGQQWFLPNLAVTFGNPGDAPVLGEPIREEYPNLHGRTRYTCRLCGECDIGCNYGSKNTLDYNYLSAAKRNGAEIRTRCEVRTLMPKEGGSYTVQYVDYSDAPEGKKPDFPTSRLPLLTITADRLILSAGTFGSTYLLLKNLSSFPHLSRQIGTRFCGNGDLLDFLLKSKDNTDGHSVPRILDGGYGPVITSTIRIKDVLEGGTGRGFYIQDAGYPEFANWMLEASDQINTLQRIAGGIPRTLKRWLHLDTNTDVGAQIASLFGSCELSSSSLPLLGMGRDIPDGRMTLTGDGKLDLDWSERRSDVYFQSVRRVMKDIARVLDATSVDNPLWLFRRLITVHPLGGCPMGRNEEEGVVDSYGEVFNYPGFYIADGSVMPGPTGPNPSLTIAALANRFAEHIIEKRSHQSSSV